MQWRGGNSKREPGREPMPNGRINFTAVFGIGECEENANR